MIDGAGVIIEGNHFNAYMRIHNDEGNKYLGGGAQSAMILENVFCKIGRRSLRSAQEQKESALIVSASLQNYQ